MDAYDLPRSVRPIQEFIDEFSTWWLRRSRDRFKGEDEEDKKEALQTFHGVLLELSKVMAPFIPFMADYVYKQIHGYEESVHLDKWPENQDALINQKVISQMDEAQKIVEMGLAARAEKGIKIRQPLSKITVYGFSLSEEFAKIIADEVNVKEVVFEKGEPKVELDIEITEELRQEGMVREIIRTINDLRKKQGLSIEDNISVEWQSESEVLNVIFANEKYILELKKNTITEKFVKIDLDSPDININGESIKFQINKI
jgi:isoleucyl-tRNA synthetase